MKQLLLVATIVTPATCCAQQFTSSIQVTCTPAAPLEVYYHLADTTRHLAHQWPKGQQLRIMGYFNSQWWGITPVAEGDVALYFVRRSSLLTTPCGVQLITTK